MITQAICHILLYYEEFQQIEDAIAREKELKGWSRSKKDTLIKEKNSTLEDLCKYMLCLKYQMVLVILSVIT